MSARRIAEVAVQVAATVGVSVLLARACAPNRVPPAADHVAAAAAFCEAHGGVEYVVARAHLVPGVKPEVFMRCADLGVGASWEAGK